MIAVLGAEIVTAGGRPSALDIGADSVTAGRTVRWVTGPSRCCPSA